MKRLFTWMVLLMASVTMAVASTWTVAGTAAALNGTTDWAPGNTENDMVTSDNNIYTLTVTNVTLEQGVTYQYKVCMDHAWDTAYPTQNKTFTVNETAVYTVVYTFNATSHAVSEQCTKTGNAGEVTHTYSVVGEPQVVFGGSKTWDVESTETDMTLDNDLYVWKKEGVTLPATTIKFKVAVDHAWGQAYPNDNYEKKIEESGIYDLTFTFDPSSKIVGLEVEKKQSVVVEDVYTVVGNNETLFGVTWDGTAEANKMTKKDNGIWEKTYTNVTLTAGNIEWKVVQNGTTWIPDGDNLIINVPAAGTYDVVFTFNENTQKCNGQLLKDGQPVVTPTAEGWPADYEGVMLQGFYWNSFEDTKWSNLEAQATELSKYFDLIWVPQSGATGGEGMGYLPVYWFNQNSNFGRKNTLVKMIKKFNELGTKVIEDVVLNHKAPKGANGSWVDFVNEKWTHDGITEELNWTPDDICQNDDGGNTNEVGASAEMIELNGGWHCGGSNDEGDDFSGGRDLDHTGANVQKNCILYLNFLQKELGYSGYRLDMVKGYSGYYTKMYNEATTPEFCVGEYWDGKDAITGWIYSTGYTSAAFDFPFKYALNSAFGGGSWNALNDKGMSGDPSWQRYSVSFVDNHDTYENSNRLVGNVLGANAFMLAMPGTPCVFLKHWQRYPIAIGNMILARKAAGVTNMSSIVDQREVAGGYLLKVQGSKGTILCAAGNTNVDLTGFKIIAKGKGFVFCVSDNINVEGLREGNDDEEAKDITVYVEAAEAPYIYAWNSQGDPVNGDWPGTQMTEKKTVDNKEFWTVGFTKVPVNLIINNGNDVQSADIEDLKHDSYFTFDATKTDKLSNWTDITSNYYQPEPIALPKCAEVLDGHLYFYFQGNKDYDSPCTWVWDDDEKNYCVKKEWPGDKMTRVGDDGKGHIVWLWDGGEIEEIEGMPTNLLFSNNGDPQTPPYKFENGGYYDATGLVGNVIEYTTVIKDIRTVKQQNAVIYNMAGQRVNANYRGIVIQNGQKRMVR